jgi:hypothetical protein
MAVSEFGLLLMLALNPNGTPNDLVSWIPPEDYFQAREIELNSGAMLRLAGSEPKSGKASFQQLLALRWLTEHPAELKKEKEARKLLETLAAGKMGDAQGFTRHYASAALAALDGKTLPPSTMPENSVKVDALSWFPEKCSIFGAADLRPSRDSKMPPDDSLRNFGQRALLLGSARARNEIYAFAEAVGNFRVDRVAMAGQAADNGKIYIRVTGLADHARLAGAIANLMQANVKEEKGPKGEPISLIDQVDQSPAMALVGDTDLIIAGYDRNNQRNNMEVVKEVLAVRAAGKGSLTSGQAELLKRAPALATGLAGCSQIPEHIRKGVTGPGSPFTVVPEHFLIDRSAGKDAQIRGYAAFDKAEDAKAFVAGVDKLKDLGIAGLKNVPEEAKVKKESLALLIKTLEGVKASADGKTVNGDVHISPDAAKAVIELANVLLAGTQKAELRPVPPPQKN